MTFRPVVLGAMVAFALAPSMALAAHGKAGLWSSTTTVTVPNMPAQTHETTYCMTPQQVASDTPTADPRSGCTYSNVHVSGQTMSADMTCKGQMNATGHFSATYDSDTHFNAKIDIAMQGMSMTNTIEGHWVKTDCAGAQQH
jgi:hypothetical protein